MCRCLDIGGCWHTWLRRCYLGCDPVAAQVSPQTEGWYYCSMSDTIGATVGLKGRIVLPQPVRQRHGWQQGTRLIFIETPAGVEIRDRDTALASLRHDLAGSSLSQELVEDRRREAGQEAR